jgi:hypothetical protein
MRRLTRRRLIGGRTVAVVLFVGFLCPVCPGDGPETWATACGQVTEPHGSTRRVITGSYKYKTPTRVWFWNSHAYRSLDDECRWARQVTGVMIGPDQPTPGSLTPARISSSCPQPGSVSPVRS